MSRFSSRRTFLKQAAALTVVSSTLGQMPARALAPSDKLNIGIIGAGGRGSANLAAVSGENIVALCDVDAQRAAGAFDQFAQAARFTDFRRMLDEQKDLDAVVISTPDHTHAPAAIMAMRRGLHVYCEKPLSHSVAEARLMRQVAASSGVATQMGNHGHSLDGSRQSVEILRSGAIGPVRTVHVWTDRPIWPQGVARPQETPAVPSTLDWDLWLGPAPQRPYHPAYAPFNWRAWWDFGTGALGDMACHVADVAFWALDLGYPETISAESSAVNNETAPEWSIVRYQFPARGELPPVELVWYDGKKKPSPEVAHGKELPDNGMILVGDKGVMLVTDPYGAVSELLPEASFAGYEPPAPTLPRSPGHHQEWINACKGGPAALSNFDYSALMTEALLLGNAAIRAGKKLTYDAAMMQFQGVPDADEFLKREYRPGYEL